MMSDDALNAFIWSEAGTTDEDVVLALMGAFYAEERLVFLEKGARAAVRELLMRPELGRVFLLRDKAGKAHGHLVLTFGFSLEFGGRFVLFDEVFVSSEVRGRGLGKEAMEIAARWAKGQGVAALRLEVNRANAHAREVYRRSGFKDEQRDMLTRWVDGGSCG